VSGWDKDLEHLCLPLTFFSTGAETLGRGMAWSDSPMSGNR
jgi:hypothetical protein